MWKKNTPTSKEPKKNDAVPVEQNSTADWLCEKGPTMAQALSRSSY